MLTVVICLGSTCYVRGSHKIADTFEHLIQKEELNAQVELVGSLCMEACSMGVSVRVGYRVYRQVDPETAEAFFYNEVVPKVLQA